MYILIKNLLTDILELICYSAPFCMLIAVLLSIVLFCAEEKGISVLLKQWLYAIKKNLRMQKMFVFLIYTALILFRTLMNRNKWINPLVNVIGIWGIYDSTGELTMDAIENFVLFVPFVFLFFCTFEHEKKITNISFRKIIFCSIKMVFPLSAGIEFSQLILRIGTFQLSDLFYNTLGGMVGGLGYWMLWRIKHKNGEGR